VSWSSTEATSHGSTHSCYRKRALKEIRSLFEEEMRSLDAYDEDIERWEDAYRRVRAAVSLAAPDGHLVREFILYIDGIKAWWRWDGRTLRGRGGAIRNSRGRYVVARSNARGWCKDSQPRESRQGLIVRSYRARTGLLKGTPKRALAS